VAGLGEALHAAQGALPTFRAHNEQAMAHAAIAFAKASKRRRAMVCTSSIGPGALNMVTAAAVAHVNRLPVLLVPGDVFASRAPDPVLQQVEDFADATVSANDCFRPVSRWFDRIERPEQLIGALPRALATMLDPATCGPATLAFCQDVQTEAADFPAAMFERRVWRIRRQPPDPREVEALAAALSASQAPLIIAGGGVIYSGAEAALAAFAERAGIPVAETQTGRGALAWDHPLALGGVGVTGTSAANRAAAEADLVIGVGTRLQDFTTGSRALFARPGVRLVLINVAAFDAAKHDALAVVGDARAALEGLGARLGETRAPDSWAKAARDGVAAWNRDWTAATAPPSANALPSDAQVIGAVWRQASDEAVVVCAAGGLPGELHKLWRPKRPGGYHLEYGFSCMGYEVVAPWGAAMARRETHPDGLVTALFGDGSYLMLNSELYSAAFAGHPFVSILCDNGGFAVIHRLQTNQGAAGFNNMLSDSRGPGADGSARVDFAAHARSLGCGVEDVPDGSDVEALRAAYLRARETARESGRPVVVVCRTHPSTWTEAGAFWETGVPASLSGRASYDEAKDHQLRWL
jgi:3D-(3,5/4)-trihydroxycyclohexane-1,2-dione acylhydrolase (decyclizing)